MSDDKLADIFRILFTPGLEFSDWKSAQCAMESISAIESAKCQEIAKRTGFTVEVVTGFQEMASNALEVITLTSATCNDCTPARVSDLLRKSAIESQLRTSKDRRLAMGAIFLLTQVKGWSAHVRSALPIDELPE